MMFNKRFLFIVFLFFIVSCGFSQIDNIPSDILKKYEKEIKKGQNASESSEAEYRTPVIQTSDSIAIPIRMEKSKEGYTERQFGYFLEPIIVEEETLQVIRKALPRELDIFGMRTFATYQTEERSIIGGAISDSYILGPGDNLIVNIWGDANFQYDLTIDSQGKVYIPEAGEINLAGYSFGQAERKLKDFLVRLFVDVSISITPGKIKNINVYVLGDVNYPGSYSMSGLSTILNALDFAGGPSSSGSFRSVKVIRSNKEIADIDLYNIMVLGKKPGNVNLASNDIVFVEQNAGLVKIRGAILRPAIYELTPKTTLAEIVEISGGLLPNANSHSIMIDRIADGRHVIKTFDLADSVDSKAIIEPYDDISIFTVEQIRNDVVFIEGHVVQQGAFNLNKGMRIADLFSDNQILYEDSYLTRVNILSILENGKRSIETIDLEKALSGDAINNIKLNNRDIIQIYSERDFMDQETVVILGEVRKPGSYTYYENMYLSDFILQAGGLTKNASDDYSEVSRIEGLEQPEIIGFKPAEIINGIRGCSTDLKIKPDDIVFIRKNPLSNDQKTVVLNGEVKYPGTYALTRENEKISDLIRRAGGFTEEAYSKGTVFRRKKISENLDNRNINDIIRNTMPSFDDSSGIMITNETDFESLSRLIISLNEAMENNRKEDIVLEDGDVIVIPRMPSGISVKGAIAFEGTIKFIEGKNVKYYINKAGGFLKNADVKQMRIVRYNGMTQKVSKGYSKVEPGDVIIVPYDTSEPANVMKIVMDTVTVLSGLATTIYIVMKL